MNNIFEIQNFHVKLENASYKSGTGHSCLIVIEPITVINSVENDGSIKQIPFNFKTLEEAQGLPKGSKLGILFLVLTSNCKIIL